MATVETDVKQQAHSLVDALPPKATWDDLLYAIYVRVAIEDGVAALDTGRKIDDEELKRRFGLR
jgi:hypothetical protein